MNKSELNKVKIGVSPLTSNVYLYSEGKDEKGFVDVDHSSDITKEFIACCDQLLNNTQDGVIRFTVNGNEREFWLSKIRPNY
jgi:hypothetical protein